MKNKILLVALLFSVQFASANDNTINGTVSPDDLNDRLRFASELLEGNWQGNDNGTTQSVSFFDDGTAQIISDNKKNAGFKQFTWSLMIQNDKLTLQMTDQISQQKFGYEVSKLTEKEIIAYSTTGEPLSLKAIETKTNLIESGLWVSLSYGKLINDDILNAYLTLELRNDGTYTRTIYSELVTMDENGTWGISPDGNFLLLQDNNSVAIQVARIMKVSHSTLVLAERINAPEHTETYSTANTAIIYQSATR